MIKRLQNRYEKDPEGRLFLQQIILRLRINFISSLLLQRACILILSHKSVC